MNKIEIVMLDKINIIAARLSDLSDIHDIETAVYPSHLAESPEVLASRIHIAADFCGVAILGHQCVGYILAHPWTDHSSPGLENTLEVIPKHADVIHLHDLAVLPVAQGAGVARLLLEWLDHRVTEHRFKTITLVAVNGADTFWSKMGFQDLGHATGYDDVARLMRRSVL